MKKAIVFALTAICFIFLPSSKLLAQAQVFNNHFEVDLSGITYFTCDGTPVQLQGTESFDIQGVINKNKANVTTHITATGSAVDEAGNTYIIQENATIKEQATLADGSFSVTGNGTLRQVSQGSAPNFSIHYQYKIVIDANGNFTVVRDRFTTSCD